MKKLICNPAYVEAPYELSYRFADGRPSPVPGPRFNEPYPDTIRNSDELAEWVMRNSIPEYVEVDA